MGSLIPESHEMLPYVENLKNPQRLIEQAGFRCTVGSPELADHGSLAGISGPLNLDVVSLQMVNDEESIVVNGEQPDLILLNNDLTEGIVPGLGTEDRVCFTTTGNGWHSRKKSHHYDALSDYVSEIAELIGIKPWCLITDWFVSKDKCLDRESCRIELAAEVDDFIQRIKNKYHTLGIDREPVVFIKNDSGTYGLEFCIRFVVVKSYYVV